MERRPGLVCLRWKFSSVKDDLNRGQSLCSKELTLESFTVDRLSTRSVSTGEITALEHELRDYTVESGALIAETILARAKLAEIASSLWHDVIVEPEYDPAQGFIVDRDIELWKADGSDRGRSGLI